jgi:hypothetical protein
VFVNAVWMFIPPRARSGLPQAGRSPQTGWCITHLGAIRGDQTNGAKYAVDGAELSQLAKAHGLLIEHDVQNVDQLGRTIAWQQLVVRVPDDGNGRFAVAPACDFERSQIATYKLGLLRTMVRIADLAPGTGATEW